MSSNIKIQRICKFCGNEFTARTTVTQYCSNNCSSRAHKAREKAAKVEVSNKETQLIKTKALTEVKAKEFLTVRDVATLLNCSIRTAYRLINQGYIKSINLSERKTLIRRSDIDKLFEQPIKKCEPQNQEEEIPIEWYSTAEVRSIYNISESGLRKMIIKYSIPKFRKGWFAYVPKMIIDDLLK